MCAAPEREAPSVSEPRPPTCAPRAGVGDTCPAAPRKRPPGLSGQPWPPGDRRKGSETGPEALPGLQAPGGDGRLDCTHEGRGSLPRSPPPPVHPGPGSCSGLQTASASPPPRSGGGRGPPSPELGRPSPAHLTVLGFLLQRSLLQPIHRVRGRGGEVVSSQAAPLLHLGAVVGGAVAHSWGGEDLRLVAQNTCPLLTPDPNLRPSTGEHKGSDLPRPPALGLPGVRGLGAASPACSPGPGAVACLGVGLSQISHPRLREDIFFQPVFDFPWLPPEKPVEGT